MKSRPHDRRSPRSAARLAGPVALAALALPVACGGGGGSGGRLVRAQPTLTLALRGPALAESAAVTVAGNALSTAPVVEVRSGALLAASADGFATFGLALPLALGDNLFEITAVDAVGRQNRVAVPTIRRETPVLRGVVGLAGNAGTALGAVVLAFGPDELFAVDRTTGDRVVISGPSRGAGIALDDLMDVALSDDGTKLFVTSLNPTGTFVVDVATGDRTRLQRPNNFTDGVVHDATRDRVAYGFSFFAKQVRVQALATGVDTVLTDGADGNAPVLEVPVALDFDAFADAFVVVDSPFLIDAPQLLGVDAGSGKRTLISDLDDPALGPVIEKPGGVVVDAARRVAYVMDAGSNDLVQVDLASGKRRFVFEDPGDDEPLFIDAFALAFDPTRREVLAGAVDALAVHDVATGKRTLRGLSPLGAGHRFVQPNRLGLEPKGGRLVEVEANGDLLEIDLATGARTRRVDFDDGNFQSFVSDLVADPDGDGLLISDSNFEQVVELDRVTYASTTISGAGFFPRGAGPPFVRPTVLAADPASGRLFVVDQFGRRIVAIERTSGDRAILAQQGDGGSVAIDVLMSLHFDPVNRQLVAVDQSQPGVLLIDPLTGVRTLFAHLPDGSMPDVPKPLASWLDGAGRGLYLIDSAFPNDRIVRVDLDDGSRTLVASPTVGGGFPLRDIVAITGDPADGRIWLGSFLYRAVLQLDPVSGDRVAISR